MAGYIFKITLENTHPPIWRRVVVPEKITFRDFHDIIQILFGWEGYHLHCFENYKYGFQIDCMEDMYAMPDMPEDKCLIDHFITELPWIRYTYDFGDDWNHKITYEKADPTYELRYASLIKYKGDNPMEDCGGVGPWMTLTDFGPEDTQIALEGLVIPKRRGSGKGRSTKTNQIRTSIPVNPMEELFTQLFDDLRRERPELRNVSDDELMNFLVAAMNRAPGQEDNDGIYYNDPEVRRQMDLLDSGKPFTIVRSKKKIHQHLAEMENQTLQDYLKYSRLEAEGMQPPQVLLADYLQEHVEILYYFFCREEMKELIDFCDYIKSGETVPETGFESAIRKCLCLGLIRLTGKRKLKLELCAEFDQVMRRIDFDNLQSIYDQLEEDIKTIGLLVMAYAALSFERFYLVYSKVAKKPMSQKNFERFIYWNGTMNSELTTFRNNLTGENYLTLPDMKPYLKYLERRDMACLFKVEPRVLSEIEIRKWRKGLNVAIPEWNEYLVGLEEFDLQMEGRAQAEEELFEQYAKIAAGMTMTELIMGDLQLGHKYLDVTDDSTEWLAWESDMWHMYAKLCVATPIIGLNGYSREQYAQSFHAPLDFIPLLEESALKKRITKNTRIHEFPRDIQMEMIEALRNGPEAYERKITRLFEKYRSNQALLMEITTIQSDKIGKENTDFEQQLDNQKFIYPWSEEILDLPKPSTYVRENKKIGRNDPCPCGSGRKYKQCCGKGK